MTIRIAMWSGPRNLSTAMMYSFAARGDCAVWDEPFYAPYLKATNSNHPMRDTILARHDANPAQVAQRCLAPVDQPVFYMKHMPHHMIDGFPLDWARDCVNVHLIRHPARVAASYGAKRDEMTLEDIGFVQQLRLYERLGGVVLDSHDIRQNPRAALATLCDHIGIGFSDTMLHWPAGARAYDGAWATHWYGAVHKSTGFAGPEGPLPELPDAAKRLVEAAMPAYQAMAAQRIRISDDDPARQAVSGATRSTE